MGLEKPYVKRTASAGEVVPITDHNKQEDQIEALTVLANRSWSTGTRPTPSADDLYPIGFNTTLGAYEFWNGVEWIQIGPFDDPVVAVEETPIDLSAAPGNILIHTTRQLVTPVNARFGGSALQTATAINQPDSGGWGTPVNTWGQQIPFIASLEADIPMIGGVETTVTIKVYENNPSVLVGSIDVPVLPGGPP